MFVFLMLCFFARAGPSNAMRMKSAQATATPKHAAKMEEATVEDTKKHTKYKLGAPVFHSNLKLIK